MQDVFFHWMFPNEAHQSRGILQLLLHFRWTWIGMVYVIVDTDQTFIRNVLPVFSRNGICFDFIEKFSIIEFSSGIEKFVEEETKLCQTIMGSSATVVVLHGEFQTVIVLRNLLHYAEFEELPVKTKGKVWIMTAQMDFASDYYQRDWDLDFIHGALSLAVHSKDIPFFESKLGRWTQVLLQKKHSSFVMRSSCGPVALTRSVWRPLGSVFDLSTSTGATNASVQLPWVVSEVSVVQCTVLDPLPILYKYHRSGGFIVGGIISQIYISSDQLTFQTHPSQAEVEPLCYDFQVEKVKRKIEVTYAAAQVLRMTQSQHKHRLSPHVSKLESIQYMGILLLLLHFSWTWIGVIYKDHPSGESFIHDVLPMFSKKNICFDFIERFPALTYSTEVEDMILGGGKIFHAAMSSSANALLVHGETQTMAVMRTILHYLAFENIAVNTKVWIMTAEMEFTSFPIQRGWNVGFLHGAISLAVHSKKSLGFQKFIQMRKPFRENKDGFIWEFWENAFACSFPDPVEDNNGGPLCTGREKWESLPNTVFEMSLTGHSNSVYDAVYAIAYALQAMQLQRVKHSAMQDTQRQKLMHQEPLQLHFFLRGVSFNNSAEEKIAFNQNGELIAGFDIINWVTFPNQSFLRVKVGQIDPGAPSRKVLSIHEEAITWPSGVNQVGSKNMSRSVVHC
uniref:Uncharacterized protein n=1 Tax=Sphaerodactylus townsendi TaxID=933632 RepID=A0ACB8EWL4_9SAUR